MAHQVGHARQHVNRMLGHSQVLVGVAEEMLCIETYKA